MNDETFCPLVGTGGKGEDRIIGSHRHACIIERGSSQFIQKSSIGIVRMISDSVSNIGYICLMAGKDLISVCAIFLIQVNVRMCFIIIFLSVILQTCKHGAILHIVTVNNGVKI